MAARTKNKKITARQASAATATVGADGKDAAAWRWGPLTWAALLALTGGAAMLAWTMWAKAQERPITQLACKVVHVYPHDADAFTQGLVYDGEALYEGTGHYGKSSLRKVDLETGRVLENLALNRRQFGEGVTLLDDKLYQLTWKSGVCLVYDKKTLRGIGTLRYRGEGWGLTHDGKHLIVSDGTNLLRFVDPKTFRVVRTLRVTERGRPVDQLNELEYVNGTIYANRWYRDYILCISPKTGEVTAWIDCTELWPMNQRPRESVLNGIAYDADTGHLLVTGKNWPKLFEIEVVSKP
jgi:glutamine cyclotransferase